jgi:hypothetical protein
MQMNYQSFSKTCTTSGNLKQTFKPLKFKYNGLILGQIKFCQITDFTNSVLPDLPYILSTLRFKIYEKCYFI